MDWYKAVKRWCSQTLGRRQEEDLEREIRAHLDLEAEEQREFGRSPDEAYRAARRAFGNTTLTKEDTRAEWRWSWVARIGQDLRYAGRGLRRNRGFTLVALLTLALGIGANTAIFSVVNTILVRPLPYLHSDRMVRVVDNVPGTATMTGLPQRRTWIPIARLSELRSQTQTLSQLAGYQSTAMTLTERVETVRLAGHRVSPSIFRLLGETAYVGRTLQSSDEQPGAPAAIVLSYSAWRTYLAGDPDIVGRGLTLDGSQYTVVGVMRQRFEFPDQQTQFWITLNPTTGPGGVVAHTIGRLKDDVSIAAAAAEINLLYERSLGAGSTFFDRVHGKSSLEAPQASGQPRIELVSVKEELVAPVREALLVLIVAVGFVLLIACTNVANLLLARTATRQREMAIRAALGAGVGRLTCQVLTESLLLGLLGGVAGSALAVLAIEVLRRLGPGVLPRLEELSVDASVLLFTMVVSVITGLLFGLAPALRLSRMNQAQAISEGSASAASGFGLFRRHSVRGTLVVGQISIAMVLLIGAGLMIHSFVKLTSVSPGFNPSNLLTFQVALPQARSHDPRLFAGELIAGLESLPGVVAAGATSILPLAHSGPTPMMGVRGLSVPISPQEAPSPRIVSQDYLTAMGIRLLDGHGFRQSGGGGRRVVLVNEAMVERYFAGENPLGKTIYFSGPRDPGWEIVGVVDNVRQSGLSANPQPELYVELRPRTDMMLLMASGGMFFAVRTAGDPASMVSRVRDLVQQIDREATLELNVASMEERLSDSVARPRLYAVLLGIFAAVAAILASIGVYGIVAYAVAQRTREIGIRIALGARGHEVLGLVLKQGMTLVVAGVAIGLLGALAVTKYLAAMLFGLSPLDPATFGIVSLVFTITAALACYVPARRAARVDPMIALRHD